MLKPLATLIAAAALAVPPVASSANAAQAPAPPQASTAMVCGVSVPLPPPTALPPAGSGPVLWQISPCFLAQDNVSLVDVQTYLYYIQLQQKRSRPTEGIWTPYDAAIEQIVRDDFKRLWATNFLDDLSIETSEYTFSNGVVGVVVTYNMEERQRIKNVDYVGSSKVDRSKIEERLREQQIELRLDTFLDPALIKRVESIARDMMVEEGFQSADVVHEIQALADGPKLVNLTFRLNEGPKVRIQRIEFVGNTAMSDRTLRKRMKQNKTRNWHSWITGGGTYQQNKYEEDAQRLTDYYRDRGYILAQISEPNVKVLGTSGDGKTRMVELTIQVIEGGRYRIGDFVFDGNTIVKSDTLRPMFELKAGDYYDQSKIRKGFAKAQEVYGAVGYMDFTGYPDPRPRDLPDAAVQGPAALAAAAAVPAGPPVVDVTVRLQEGKQFYVNRIIFTGNTTTRDNVIRREMRVLENGVFNTEALKFSVRRLNQLGYFKALEEGKDIAVDKTAGSDNKVDVNLKLEEQNRNQLQFGAGVSQFEGFFGQLSFQTANFLGRGETLTMAVSAGSRAENYSLGFTEPFLFDRNITGSASLFRSDVRYIGQFTQRSTGGTVGFGFPIGNGFTKGFMGYSYERIRVTDVADVYTDPQLLQRNPFLADSLLVGANGERVISRITPSIVQNSLDQPIFPTTGHRLSMGVDLAGLGGNTNFYKPNVEAIWYFRQNARMSLGIRGQVEAIRALTKGSKDLPIFEKIFQGGEYSIRGFDLRTVGPQDPISGVVLGGDKSFLFNIEQSFTIAAPVRLILFYDAGQVRDKGQPFSLWEDKIERTLPTPPLVTNPFASQIIVDPAAPSGVISTVVGRQSAFKTSTGAEIRFFMPVLNVPFRLIFAYNPQRGGVLNNSLEPAAKFTFRFAVGTMF